MRASASKEANQEEVASEESSPGLSSQEGPILQESWEEARQMFGDMVLPQDFEPGREALLEKTIERPETHDGDVH